MRVADFDYELPEDLIAQHPLARRDESRLLVHNRAHQSTTHHHFHEIVNFLKKDDILILNDTKVFPARLRGQRSPSGGKVELLLLEETQTNQWWAMIKPGKRLREGECFELLAQNGEQTGCRVRILAKNSDGHGLLEFQTNQDLWDLLPELGEIPLPPYITRGDTSSREEDLIRYQTTYAARLGSVAAPTAGLHFTPGILSQIEALGVGIGHVTLHVGAGTFQPVKSEDTADHVMHEERYHLPQLTLERIRTAKAAGGRVVAAGTTSLRVLESAAAAGLDQVAGSWQRTRLFVQPPHQFSVTDALLTNFHLPRSTLLMLVSAFLAPGINRGREQCLRLYQEAIQERYRFFSYGDAMLIL